MNYENVTSIKTLIDHPGGIFSYRNWDDLADFYFDKYGAYINRLECTRVLHLEQCTRLNYAFTRPVFPKTHCSDIKDETYRNTHVLSITHMDWLVGFRAGCWGLPDERNTGYCSIRFELDPYKKHAYSEGKRIQNTMLQMLARCANISTPMFVLIQEPYIEGYVNILKQCDPAVVRKLNLGN